MKKIFIISSCVFLLLAIVFFGLSMYESRQLEIEQEEIDDLMKDVFITDTTPTTDTTNSATNDVPSTGTSDDMPVTGSTTENTETEASEPDTTTNPPKQNDKPKYTTPVAVDIDELKKKNSDIGGWIYLENSNVNYPFVFSTGNEYLRKSIYGKSSSAGTIYCYDNQKISSVEDMDKNIVFYGHNMNNGTMFYYVDYLRRNPKYLNNEYNKYIYIYTEKYIYKYQIFSVYKIEKDENFNQIYFKGESDFQSFCNSLYEKSVYKGFRPDFSDNAHIITFATCTSGSSKTHRTALHAVLVDISTNNY